MMLNDPYQNRKLRTEEDHATKPNRQKSGPALKFDQECRGAP